LEVVKFAARDVVKLPPLILACNTCGSVWNVDFVIRRLVATFGGEVDELEDKRSPRYDARATREKVTADDVLEDGRFA
jgi:hypothetical protein